MANKCGYCDYKSIEINDFIPHFKEHHHEEILRIKVPLYDTGTKRKYSLMNYQTRICDLKEHMMQFDDKLNLHNIDDTVPGGKKPKLISKTEMKQENQTEHLEKACQTSFDNAENDRLVSEWICYLKVILTWKTNRQPQ